MSHAAGALHAVQAGTIVLAGAGQMGGAMLQAWLDSGVDAARLAVLDPHVSDAWRVRLDAVGVAVNPLPAEPRVADVLVLAVKPQVLDTAAPTLHAFVGPETTLVSIVAGKTMADLRRAFPMAGALVRAMPNTPAAIRQGVTGVVADARITSAGRAAVQALLEAVGSVEWVAGEEMIDAVTAVSGSGPAYVFYLAECLAAAAEAAGLEPAAAARLARATVQGAGALMAARPDTSPASLRRSVTSPGGTTAAALETLSGADGLPKLMEAAVRAAKRRAAELSG